MKRIFFISGLGANEKAFEKLDEFGLPKVMIQWLDNEGDESLFSYANRIINKYGITNIDIIVGLSFGGLIAQQIAAILHRKEVVLISSFRTKNDLNLLFRIGLKLRLYKLMPQFNIPIVNRIVAIYLNSGSKGSNSVLTDMLEETDFKLVKWSIQKIYEQESIIDSDVKLYNILGSTDRIVSFWKNESTYKVDNGSHFMVYEKAKMVSSIIKELIKD